MKIEKNAPYVIAEMAYGFEGDKKYLMEQTLQAPDNIDAVKYHMLFDVDEYIAPCHSIYPLVKSWILNEEDWICVLKKAKERHEVIVLADDRKSLRFCAEYSELVDGIEVHAACVNDKELLHEAVNVAKKYGKTMFIGISGFEVQELFCINEYIKNTGLNDVIFMYGFQNYPTKISEVRLSKIPLLCKMLGRPVGYADHTGWDEAEKELMIYTSYALGANVQEIHFTLCEGEKRTDCVTAVSAKRIAKIADALKQQSKALGQFDVRLNESEKKYLNFRKVPVYVKDFEEGYCIGAEDIKFIRVEHPSYQHQFGEESVFVGRKLKGKVLKNTEIKGEDFY